MTDAQFVYNGFSVFLGVVLDMVIEHILNYREIRKLVTKWHKDAISFYPKDSEIARLIIAYSDELGMIFGVEAEAPLRGDGPGG